MKTVIITGAASGIGLSATYLFLARGWRVVMVDRNENKKVFEEIERSYEPHVFFFKGDVSKDADIKKLHKFTKDNVDAVDCIINNAGVIIHGLLHSASEKEWDDIFNTDVKGIYLTTKYFIEDMIESGGGTIVNTASISGLHGDFEMPVYNAAKGAVVNLTRAMALDYAEYNIRVNSVCPGATDTPFLNQENIPKYSRVNPLKRICQPEEVAKAMYFLASNEGSYCNGVNLPVTGGLDVQTGQPK